jgi:chemotaxis protein MotA
VDLTTLVGIVLGWACILASILMTPNSGLGLFLNLPSALIVLGGTASAILMGFRGSDLRALGRVLKLAFFQPLPSAAKIIADFRRYADIARRDGILALEKVTGEVDDPFLLQGMQHAVDGLDPDVIQNLMRTELEYMSARHERGIRILRQIGAYAPAFGMVGTLIGLVIMLANLREPGAIGPSMAVAIITTFYGAAIAYLFALPLADKLTVKNHEELILREMMIKGLASIQSGDSPRVVEQKLKVLLPPAMRAEAAARESGR